MLQGQAISIRRGMGCRNIGVIHSHHMAQQALQPLRITQIQQPFTAPETQMGACHPNHYRTARRRWFIPTPKLLTRFDQRQRAARGHTKTMQRFGGDQFAYPTFQGEASIPTTTPRRGATPLAAKVLQLAGSITQLAIEKAAAISELGVVSTKLIAVIAESKQGNALFKTAIGSLEVLIRHTIWIHPQLTQQCVVAKAQLSARKHCSLHHIPVSPTQTLD